MYIQTDAVPCTMSEITTKAEVFNVMRAAASMSQNLTPGFTVSMPLGLLPKRCCEFSFASRLLSCRKLF